MRNRRQELPCSEPRLVKSWKMHRSLFDVKTMEPNGAFCEPRTGKIQVMVPEGVSSGQQIQVTTPTGEQLLVAVPPGVAPGQTMEVQLPGKGPGSGGPNMQQIMTGRAQYPISLLSKPQAQEYLCNFYLEPGFQISVPPCRCSLFWPSGLVPGMAANNDAPFLYLDRPFAIDCCCLNRPKVDVFDVRGTATVKLGIISAAWAATINASGVMGKRHFVCLFFIGNFSYQNNMVVQFHQTQLRPGSICLDGHDLWHPGRS